MLKDGDRINAQPAPIEPTPTRKGDTFTRALAGIIVEAERATEAEAKNMADSEALAKDLDERIATLTKREDREAGDQHVARDKEDDVDEPAHQGGFTRRAGGGSLPPPPPQVL